MSVGKLCTVTYPPNKSLNRKKEGSLIVTSRVFGNILKLVLSGTREDLNVTVCLVHWTGPFKLETNLTLFETGPTVRPTVLHNSLILIVSEMSKYYHNIEYSLNTP